MQKMIQHQHRNVEIKHSPMPTFAKKGRKFSGIQTRASHDPTSAPQTHARHNAKNDPTSTPKRRNHALPSPMPTFAKKGRKFSGIRTRASHDPTSAPTLSDDIIEKNKKGKGRKEKSAFNDP
eukprot:222565_1